MAPGSSGDQPTSTMTAMTPTTRPAATRAEMRWPMNPTAIAAVNSGVAAFRSEVNPAGSVTVATAIKVNGTAENRAPATRKLVIRPRATRSVRSPGNEDEGRGPDRETRLRRPRRPDLW